MSGLQALSRGVGGGGGAGGHPLPAVDVHVADQVVLDGGATVVLWRQPAQLHVLGSHLVRHEGPRLGGHVKHVHVAGGLESSCRTAQLNRVLAGVTGSVRLD